MTDDDVRAIILAGESVQYPITMEERAKLHILPDQLRWRFQCAMVDYAERKMYEGMWEWSPESYEIWQREYYRRKQITGG